MKSAQSLLRHRLDVLSIVQRHNGCNLRVFGSVLRGDDQDDSDIDLLIDPLPQMSLFDLGAIKHELQILLGKSVDILTPNGLPDHFKASVLAEAKPV